MTQRMRYDAAISNDTEDLDDVDNDSNNAGDNEKEGLILRTSTNSTGISSDNLYIKFQQGISQVESGGKVDLDNFAEFSVENDNSHGTDEALMRTGKIFGGLIADINRKKSWFFSDFRDALHMQTIATIIYIYLATITKAITFGGFLSEITNDQQGVLEAFLGKVH